MPHSQRLIRLLVAYDAPRGLNPIPQLPFRRF
jgi:hypothetical protein